MGNNLYGAGENTLGKAAEMVATARQDFDALSKNLTSKIEGLESQWKGQGGQAFFALHAAWTQKQQVVTSALNDFEASLKNTQKDNVSTDETQHGNYSKFQSRLH